VKDTTLWWVLGGLAAGALLLVRRRRKAATSSRGCPPLRDGTFAGFRYHVVPGASTPIVFLHGRGGTEKAFAQKVGLPGIYVRGPVSIGRGAAWTQVEFADVDFAAQLDAAVERIVPFLSAIQRCYGTPILAGHSQGGAVVLALVAKHPELLSGAVVASTGIPRSMWQKFTVPVIVVAGTEDEIVPYNGVLDMVDTTGAELYSVAGARHELTGTLLDEFKRALT